MKIARSVCFRREICSRNALIVAHRFDLQQRKQQRIAAELFDAPRQLGRLFTRSRDDDVQSGERQAWKS